MDRLKRIEVEITSRLPVGKDEHIGSIKIISPPVKIPHHLRNLFSKEPTTTVLSATDIRHSGADRHEAEEVLDDDPEEDEVVQMLQGSTGRGHASRQVTSWRTARWEEPKEQKQSVMELFQSGPLHVVVVERELAVFPSPRPLRAVLMLFGFDSIETFAWRISFRSRRAARRTCNRYILRGDDSTFANRRVENSCRSG